MPKKTNLEYRVETLESKMRSIERALWAIATLVGGALINYFLDKLNSTSVSGIDKVAAVTVMSLSPFVFMGTHVLEILLRLF